MVCIVPETVEEVPVSARLEHKYMKLSKWGNSFNILKRLNKAALRMPPKCHRNGLGGLEACTFGYRCPPQAALQLELQLQVGFVEFSDLHHFCCFRLGVSLRRLNRVYPPTA